MCKCRLIFCETFILIAPYPLLTRLCGNNHGMPGILVMGGHMPGGGIVAAECSATGLAGTQVQPAAALFYTYFTFILLRVKECFQLQDMDTGFLCHIL